MSKIVIAAAAFGMMVGSALAQTTMPAPTTPPAATPPANQTAPTNPAVNSSGPNNPGAPAAGANSFTEAQAKSRLEANGYSGVGTLAKDKDGVWRGNATRNGQSVEVAVDYQGNIVAR
ncbi:hypothetical protein EDC65_1964 [Stella humosa]|uniref:YpeB-like protein with protease inhibitory function n=1 Tax=Stella humosa TaxID=94 RepID=A0A3N1M922_9PROT|nr:hypothetical protein [Stella humosa]ROQ00168.1 hypothetical protein EDC65_1964 [Stella humosa]BBK30598.1 hypothetical protein STHU_12320 [Stella humosa]